jgi:hypothetical protein
MKITVLINEHQKKQLLVESSLNQFTNVVKNNYEFVKSIIQDSSKQMGMNLEFLITWGASIGGFVGPLNDFIKGEFPDISSTDLSLILTGIISIYYLDNKKFIKNILSLIEEKGLKSIFSVVLNKSKEFKSVFVEFISSLNLTLHKVTNIMSYTFILPLIPMLFQMAQSGQFNQQDIKEISIRLAGFGLLTVTGNMIKEIITKILKRFKG